MKSLTDREIKDYYLWKYVAQAAPYLSDNFTDTNFEFSKVMSGVEQQRPRWKRALGVPDDYMGEAIGQLYVEKYFPETSYLIEHEHGEEVNADEEAEHTGRQQDQPHEEVACIVHFPRCERSGEHNYR